MAELDYAAGSLEEYKQQRDAIKDPALKQQMAEEDQAIDRAYEKLSGDWEMSGFFDLMATNMDEWYQTYKDDFALIRKIRRAAGLKAEKVGLSEPVGFPKKSFETTTTQFVEVSLGATGTKICIPVTKVSTDTSSIKVQKEKPYGELLAMPAEMFMSDRPRTHFATSCINTKEMSMQLQLYNSLLFSASSVPMGNVGQGNYTAANAILHAVVSPLRQASPGNKLFACIQWGAVGGIGMRWKAFATQDMLQAMEGFLMTINDAATILRGLLTQLSIDPPENVGAQVTDPQSFAMQNPPPFPGMFRTFRSDPKGGDGGGGFEEQVKGITSAAIMSLQDPDNRTVEVDPNQILVGQHPEVGLEVTIMRMRKTAEFNGLKGTITEQTDSGFVVRLNDEDVEALIATGYVDPDRTKKTYSVDTDPTAIKKEPGHPADGSDTFCICGSWNDYLPIEMAWEPGSSCYISHLNVAGKAYSFYFVKGAPTGKKMKARATYKGKTWSVPRSSTSTWYEIRLVINDYGSVKKVDIIQNQEGPEDDSMAILAEGDGE